MVMVPTNAEPVRDFKSGETFFKKGEKGQRLPDRDKDGY
jgi:hypothetical protein